MTHTKAFAHYNTKPTNVQWSWSARNEVEKTVVVTIWRNQIKRRDGRYMVEVSGSASGKPDKRLGHSELMNNLKWAQDNCEGKIRVIMAIPVTENTAPLKIRECAPWKVGLRLIHLDTNTGAWAAESEPT